MHPWTARIGTLDAATGAFQLRVSLPASAAHTSGGSSGLLLDACQQVGGQLWVGTPSNDVLCNEVLTSAARGKELLTVTLGSKVRRIGDTAKATAGNYVILLG